MASVYRASDAAAYERSMGRWSARLARPFVDFAGVAGAGHVLDLGCGTGSLAFALDAPRVTGLDQAEAFVAAARARAGGDPRFTFDQGDAQALPYPDAGFDAALSLLVLNFVPDPMRAAREMVRVTRPGGVVAAAVWDFRGGLGFIRLCADIAAVLDPRGAAFRDWQLAAPLSAPGELAAAWTALGLRDVAQEGLTIRTDFADFADYWDPWLAGQGTVGAFVASLDPAARGALEHHLRAAYCAGGPDGPRSFTATAWAVRGVVSD